MKSFFSITLILLIFSCSVNESGLIKLVVKGKSGYKVIIPENPSSEEIRAARFLTDHIKKISGCELPVVKSNNYSDEKIITISKSTDIAEGDNYSVSTNGKTIHIKGGSKKGCIYAVAEILEKQLGVRYFSPDYVVIPNSGNVFLYDLNFTGSSPNTYRNVHGSFTNNTDYKDFNRLHEINDMFAIGYYVHTFNRLIPWKEHFKKHPEYFALMNGKRIIDQLCLTNPEVYTLTIKKLKEEMALQSDKQIWSVSQDDNFSYCQCENCTKIIEEEQSPAGPVIRFVNKVAEQFPEKIISTLAYQYSRKAPLTIKPLDNVQIMLCTIELNRSKPIASDPSSVSFLKDLVDWGKISNHIYLWDYTVDFAHSISPFPNLHTLKPNIQLFVKNNVKEHFQQSNTGVGHEFSELKSYLLAKLLWNPDAPYDEIIKEFTDGFYGPAGSWIREYIYAMQTEIRKTGEWLDIYGPPTNYQKTFLSAENVEKYNNFFDEAEKAAAGNPDFLLHVRIARMPLQYAMMEIGKNDMFGSRGWYTETNGEFIPRKEMTDMLEAFFKTSKDCKSTPVNESGLTAEAYYLSTKRFIDVQVKGNIAFRKKVTASPTPSGKYSGSDLSFLTNGVRGASDYKVHWLGWEAKDFSLLLDLEKPVIASTIEISTLWDPKSWILHPASVSCLISEDGKKFQLIEKQIIEGNQQKEGVSHLFSFKVSAQQLRYVKFDIKSTLKLFDWHPSAGGGSWVFADEVIVK